MGLPNYYVRNIFAIFTSECERPSESIDDIWLLLLLLARFVKFSTIETREALLHGLLRPLSSNLRIEATSEVVGRLLQPQMQPKRLFQALGTKMPG